MNRLSKFFETYHSDQGRATYKLKSYEAIYEKFLSDYCDKPVVLVEVGIGYGGCLQMWREFLGKCCKIYGIDKDDTRCFKEEQIECFAGDQGNKEFIRGLKELIPIIDIFIDDGSHINSHQIETFESIFPIIADRGIYFCEDTHTSYRSEYGGGYKKSGTFIEYCKYLIDCLHHTEDEKIDAPDFIHSIDSITFFRSLVMVKKR